MAEPRTRLLEGLRASRLLDEQRLSEVQQWPSAGDDRHLADELVARGLLTRYQVDEVMAGRADKLVIGPYRILEEIGRGGMGQVFKAVHEQMQRLVALKVLTGARQDDPAARARFMREVRASAQLNHPNIVIAHDVGQASGVTYLALEYVEGHDVRRLLADQGRLAPTVAAGIALQVAVALEHAHQRGIVHRDIKPSNILISQSGIVKVLDMGLALIRDQGPDSAVTTDTLTHAGTVMGTMDYLAPEQAMDSHQADIRADIYSLGCTLYEMLTGQVPYPGGSAAQKLMRHQMREPTAIEELVPEVPAGLAAVVRRMMAKRPEDRYQTPAEVIEALRPWAGGETAIHQVVGIVSASRPAPTRTPPPEVLADMTTSTSISNADQLVATPAAGRVCRRAVPLWVWPAAVVGVAVVAAAVFWSWQSRHAVPPASEPAGSASRPTESGASLPPREEPSAQWPAVAMKDRTAWLEDLKADQTISRSEAIDAVWRQRRDQLLRELKGEALADLRQYLQWQELVRQIQVRLKQLDQEDHLPRGLALADKHRGRAWCLPIVNLTLKRREEELSAALKAMPWSDGLPDLEDESFRRAWSARTERFRRWLADLARLVDDFAALEDGLNAGYGLEDRPAAATQPMGRLYASWREHPAWRDPAVQEALQGVIRRVDELVRIAGLTDRGELTRLILAEGPALVALAAWQRLGRLTDPAWPAGRQELEQELRLQEKLRGKISQIENPSRRGELEQTLRRDGARRWHDCLRRLQEQDEIEAAIRLKERFGVSDSMLDSRSRYNLLVYAFRQQAARPADDAALLKAVAAFAAEVGALGPEVAARPEVRRILDELAAVRPGRLDPDPRGAGPGASLLAGRWEARVAEAGRRLTYTWKPAADSPLALGFVCVEPGDGRPAFYLATTEVSLGLVIEVLTAANRWSEFGSLISPFDRSSDPRSGPRVWQWNADRTAIEPSDHWLLADPERPRDKEYAPGLSVPRPTRDHPMQYISPAAAAAVAALLGCRLPTAAEWKAACALQAKAGPSAPANLRDKTWLAQRDHVAALGLVRPPWPDRGIFWPAGMTRAASGPDSPARPEAGDDGLLWFAPVGSDPAAAFEHLIGNVAEYVVPSPLAPEKPAESSWLVIGGSALSAPDVKWDQPYPVDPMEARRGFADVGFRLAFTAATVPVARQVAEATRHLRYLPPDRP